MVQADIRGSCPGEEPGGIAFEPAGKAALYNMLVNT